MQKALSKYTFALILLSFAAVSARGQSSSLNTFSPYTFYGLGDLAQPGTAQTHSMGSVGVAMRSQVHLNYLNPAAYSAVPRQSFLLNFGMQGANYYLKTKARKTSYNTYNLHDVGVMFPLGKKIGFGLSLTPFSNVGYRIIRDEDDPGILAQVGKVRYVYLGDGGVNELKAGVGMEVAKGLSVGLNFIYYLGSINRTAETTVSTVITDATYRNTLVSKRTTVNEINGSIGVQYQISMRDPLKNLTLGATYQPRLSFRAHEDEVIQTQTSSVGDSVLVDDNRFRMKMPGRFSAGIFYHTPKIGLGFDFSYQNWKDAFEIPAKDNIQLTSAQDYRFGLEYTPDRFNMRTIFRRSSYRVGVRYNNSYLMRDRQQIKEYAFTAGVGVPLRAGSWTSLNAGIELGRRGNTSHGLIRENFFKVFVGFSLFGEDLWFVKPKFD